MDYNKLWSLINEKNLSKGAAARVVGMSTTGFIQMMDRKTMAVSTLEKFADYFHVPIAYFFSEYEQSMTECLQMSRYKEALHPCAECAEKERTIEAQKKTIDIQDKYIKALEKVYKTEE